MGAGLGGLSCALHLVAAGREVTVLERTGAPGGHTGLLELSGYRFDTGPTMLTSPTSLSEPLNAVGEQLTDWLDLDRVEPAYRAHFPDGATIDVHSDPERMAAEIAAVCGPREAAGFRRFIHWVSRLRRLERSGAGPRRLAPQLETFFADHRTRRIFSLPHQHTGLAAREALVLQGFMSYLDAVAGVWHPRGGMHTVPRALAAVAEKHGVIFRYDTQVTRLETSVGRAVAVHTAEGERLTADALVLNADLPTDTRPAPRRSPGRRAPSCVLLHLGARAQYGRIAHHNVHFGRAWHRTFDEVVNRGELMSDPSLLVTNPTATDPSMAPAGRHSYLAQAPVPNLRTAPVRWDGPVGRRYAGELMATLEARGYLDLGAGLELSYVVTPDDWARQGMPDGTPFAGTQLIGGSGRHGPNSARTGNLHPVLSNVVFIGSANPPGAGMPDMLDFGKLAADCVVGPARRVPAGHREGSRVG